MQLRLLQYFKTKKKILNFKKSWRAESVSELTNNSTVITIDGSRSGHVLLYDVQTDDGSVGGWRRRCMRIMEIPDPEEDLPRHQVREEGGGRRKQRMLRDEIPNAGPEWPHMVGRRRLRREGEEVVEICCYSPLHPFRWSLVHNHHGPHGHKKKGLIIEEKLRWSWSYS